MINMQKFNLCRLIVIKALAQHWKQPEDEDNRVRTAWNSWRGISGVNWDRMVPVQLKNKLFKTVIRPTLIYGSECGALHRAEKQRNRDENATMKVGGKRP